MRRRWRSWCSRGYGKGDLEVDFAMVRKWGEGQAAGGAGGREWEALERGGSPLVRVLRERKVK